MGQSNLQRIQSSVVDLTDGGEISRQQAQLFLKDYIASGQNIKDINYFLENQSIDLFMKYFINTVYFHLSGNSTPNDQSGRSAEQKSQAKLGCKIVETGCTEMNEKVRYLITDIKNITLSERSEILSVREKIKDYIISYLEIQSYRYYYYSKGAMKETNSKILYLYDTSHQSEIFKYAQTCRSADQPNQLEDILKEKYLNYQNLCFQFWDEQALHIVVVEINMEKWKYSKCTELKIIRNIFRNLFALLAKKMIDIYDARQDARQTSYKNFFTQFTLMLIQHFIFLESKRIEYLVSQLKSEVRGVQKIQSNQQCILSKVRNWKQCITTNEKVLVVSYNKKKTLEFVYQNDESLLQLSSYKQQILEMQQCLYFFLEANKKRVKKVLKAFQRQCNQRMCFSENIIINIGYDSSSSDQKTLTLIYLLERGNPKSKLMRKQKESDSLPEKENVLVKRLVSFQKSDHPGLDQTGWFRQFIREESENMSESKKIQRKNIMKLPKLNREYRISNFKSLYLQEELKERIDVDDDNINLLLYAPGKLEIFVLKVFSKLPFFRRLPHEKDEFPKFLRQIHLNYEKHGNKFHNFTHAVNVMHMCYLLCRCSRNEDILSQFDKFIIIFSGLCHDVGHTGFTNLFEIASQSDIALTYNNRSPLQMFHASQAFEILRKSPNNFLFSLSPKEFTHFRQLTISSILYTDIKEHFNLMKKFEASKEGEVSTLAGMIIHASDFGGSVKNFEVCKTWSLLVNQQFTNQYKEEGRLGLPQTPFMKDLQKIHILAKNETGFLKVIVHPLYRELSLFYEDKVLIKMVKNVESNMRQWENYLECHSQQSQFEVKPKNIKV